MIEMKKIVCEYLMRNLKPKAVLFECPSDLKWGI